jgi:hypothetical protein
MATAAAPDPAITATDHPADASDSSAAVGAGAGTAAVLQKRALAPKEGCANARELTRRVSWEKRKSKPHVSLKK